MAFQVWFFHSTQCFQGFLHTVVCVSTSALLMAEQRSIVWLCPILFIRPSVDGRVGCFVFVKSSR